MCYKRLVLKQMSSLGFFKADLVHFYNISSDVTSCFLITGDKNTFVLRHFWDLIGYCSFRAWPSALLMYCMFWHGERKLSKNNIIEIIIIIKLKEKKKVLHRISEFLQIFTRQIQALVYLWLEKPNIARVMHSQSFCVPLLCFQGSLGNWYVYFHFFCFLEFFRVTG